MRRKEIYYIILYIYIYEKKYVILRYVISHVRKHPLRRVYIIYMFIHLKHIHRRIHVHAPCVYTYILNNNNKDDDASCCTFARYRRISRTYACPMIMYVSDIPLRISLVPGEKNDNAI